MTSLMDKITREIEAKRMKTSEMGTEGTSVRLSLTNEEISEFQNYNLDEHYFWEIDGNDLIITYTEDI